MVGLDKYIIIRPNFQANHYTKSVSWVSVAFPEATEKIQLWLWLAPRERVHVRASIQALGMESPKYKDSGWVHLHPENIL